MSRQLMDYVSARHDAILSVLKLLTAEHQLSDACFSVLDVTGAEAGADSAARALAEAVDALPLDRKPAGWSEPPAAAGVVRAARARFVKAAIRCLAAEYADESAGAGYADEQMALAARNLTADAEARRAARALPAAPVLPVEWPAGAGGAA